jgi:hypothetical protein
LAQTVGISFCRMAAAAGSSISLPTGVLATE